MVNRDWIKGANKLTCSKIFRGKISFNTGSSGSKNWISVRWINARNDFCVAEIRKFCIEGLQQYVSVTDTTANAMINHECCYYVTINIHTESSRTFAAFKSRNITRWPCKKERPLATSMAILTLVSHDNGKRSGMKRWSSKLPLGRYSQTKSLCSSSKQ